MLVSAFKEECVYAYLSVSVCMSVYAWVVFKYVCVSASMFGACASECESMYLMWQADSVGGSAAFSLQMSILFRTAVTK
jgi:hypothetical protein